MSKSFLKNDIRLSSASFGFDQLWYSFEKKPERFAFKEKKRAFFAVNVNNILHIFKFKFAVISWYTKKPRGGSIDNYFTEFTDDNLGLVGLRFPY